MTSNQSPLLNNQTGSNSSNKRKHTVTNIKIKEDNKYIISGLLETEI